MPKPELSLVLPIYNEGKTLSGVLDWVIAKLEALSLEFELVCVDDGSDDSSGAIVAELAGRDSRVRALSSPRNLGKGAAVRRGVRTATGRWIVTLDADLSTDLALLPRALGELEAGASLVIGDRRLPDSRIHVRQPRVREIMGRTFSRLARVAVDPSIADFTCGFKAYQRDAARQVFDGLETTRWAFDVEVIAIARSRKLSIVALPVDWTDRRETRVRFPGDAVRAFADLVRITWRFRCGAYRE